METLKHIVHIEGLGNTVLISTIFRWRRDYRSNDSPTHACSLLHAITSTAILDCSVVHDHIFSIVGLTSSIMTTNYSTPILELYLRTLAETLVDLSRDTPAPEASIKDFDNQLFAFWVNLLLSLCLSPSDPLVVLTTRALGSNLGLLAMDPKSLQELEGLNALERTLWNPRALEITKRFDRLRANVKFRIVNERLERKVRKDANLTEAGEGGRTMPCSAWIELSRRIAREVVEAKSRQVEERVAKSKAYVPEEAEDPERPAPRDNC
ncbi:hypothetical protein KC326_g26 [Hortaea werneckii]|nr:hypothetical protein KC326_g26 [Hortaea werneckii]